LGRLLDGETAPTYDGFIDDLRGCAARIVSLCGDSDIVFVGRSPEHLFDYLSGLFADMADAPGIQLLHYSNRWVPPDKLIGENPGAVDHLFRYFQAVQVDPASIATRPRAVTLCDVVSRGGTFENLVKLLYRFAERQSADWNVVQRRLRIVGLTWRGKNSPNAFRWQQHQDWLELIPKTPIRNVSVAGEFCGFCAGPFPKVTESFDVNRWASEAARFPTRDSEHLNALRLAVRLYDLGNSPQERERFARLLAGQPEVREPEVRSLILALRGKRQA
jgi:hypothetical protein